MNRPKTSIRKFNLLFSENETKVLNHHNSIKNSEIISKEYLDSNNNNTNENVNTEDEIQDNFLSEDEDIASSTSFMSSLNNIIGSNNAAKCEKECMKRPLTFFNECKGLIDHKMTFSEIFSMFTCGVVRNIAYYILMKIVYTIQIIVGFLKDFTNETNLIRVFLMLPKATIEHLYCFCGMNVCRQFKIRGYMTLKSRLECPANDSIMTKCSWPLWTIFSLVLLTIGFGCYYSCPHSTLGEKYAIGRANIKWLKERILFNVYNLPGYNCMMRDNCCNSKTSIMKRWTYCLLTLPYRTALQGMRTEKIDLAAVEESIKNISDWRLRRNIHRLKVMLEQNLLKFLMISRKREIIRHNLYMTNSDVAKNFSSLIYMLINHEKIDHTYDETMKLFDTTSNQVLLLLDVKKLFTNTATDSMKCMRCSAKRGIADLEKFIANEIKIAKGRLDKMKSLAKKSQINSNNLKFSKAIKCMRKVLKKVRNQIIGSQARLDFYDSFRFRFKSDTEILKHHVIDKTVSTMVGHHQINKELLERVEKYMFMLTDALDSYINQQRILSTQQVEYLFNEKFKVLRKSLLQNFCPKIKEFVKLTVLSTLTLAGTMKPCGLLAGGQKLSGDAACRVQLDSEVGASMKFFQCCPTSSSVLDRTRRALEIFDADLIGSLDFGLAANGAAVLEAFTSANTLLREGVIMVEPPLFGWATLLNGGSGHKMVNSVYFLNLGKVRPGLCWQFRGSSGSTIIELAKPVLVNMVTIEHIPACIAASGDLSDAPRHFELMALESENDDNVKLLGSFIFDNLDGYPLQQFQIENPEKVKFVKFVILSNHGADVTCVYRLRIHGKSMLQDGI